MTVGQVGTPTARPPLPLIYAITATGIMVNTLVTPVIPEILDGLGASRGLAGVVVGAATLPGVALAPVIGLLADRYGRREVLVPCLVLFAGAGVLGGLAPSLWVLVLARFLQGTGSAGLVNLAVVIIGDHWEGTERARIIGRNAAVLTICLAVYPVVGGALAGAAGWRAPFALYLTGLLTAALLVRRLERTPRRDVRFRDQLAEAWPVLRSMRIAGILVTTVVTFVLIFGLLLTVLPVYLAERFAIAPSLRGVLLGLPALANTAAALSIGRMRRRLGPRALLVLAAAVFALSFALVAAAPGLGWVIAGVLLFGAGEGVMLPNLQDLAAGSATAATRGTIVAVFVSSARLGQTIGPLGAGAVAASAGAPVTFAAGAGLAALLAVALGGIGRGGGAAAGTAPGVLDHAHRMEEPR